MLDPTEQLPPAFWAGVEQFNHQEFYTCHDTLEALWMEASEPLRTFYQGILQIAVACYHLTNGNRRGAMILLGEGNRRLGNYPDQVNGLQLAAFRQQAQKLLVLLQESTQGSLNEPPVYSFPQIVCLPTEPDPAQTLE